MKSIRTRSMQGHRKRKRTEEEKRWVWTGMIYDPSGKPVPKCVSPIAYINFKPVRVAQSDD